MIIVHMQIYFLIFSLLIESKREMIWESNKKIDKKYFKEI